MGIRKAAQRRLNFELGIPYEQVNTIGVCLYSVHLQIGKFIWIKVRPENFHYLTRIHYEDVGDGVWGEHEIDYILFLQKDVDLSPNSSEVSEVFYVRRKNLDRYSIDDMFILGILTNLTFTVKLEKWVWVHYSHLGLNWFWTTNWDYGGIICINWKNTKIILVSLNFKYIPVSVFSYLNLKLIRTLLFIFPLR